MCSSPHNKCVWPLSCLGNLLADNLTQIAIKNNKHNHFPGESIILSPSFEIYTHFHHLFVHKVEKILTLCLITFNDQSLFKVVYRLVCSLDLNHEFGCFQVFCFHLQCLTLELKRKYIDITT